MSWSVERRRGTAAALHAVGPAYAQRGATWLVVDRPSLVLGSAQADVRVDLDAAARLGIDVARRRSGGGGVLLWPGEHLWLDVVVPRGDPWWDDDVGRAMWWLGDVWAEALLSVGVAAEVHRAGLVASPWSSDVCFAGIGAGEVHHGPAKLVGISQRRTRDGARLQSMLHLRWRPETHAALIATPAPAAEDLAPLVGAVAVPASVMQAAVEAALASR